MYKKNPDRDPKYDKSSEILPKPCFICNKLVYKSDNYRFKVGKYRRDYYHAKCEKKEE